MSLCSVSIDQCFLNWGKLVPTHRFDAGVWKTIVQSFTKLMVAIRKIPKHFSSMSYENIFNFENKLFIEV